MGKSYKKSIIGGSGMIRQTEAVLDKVVSGETDLEQEQQESVVQTAGTFSSMSAGGTQVVQTRIPFEMKDRLDMMVRQQKRSGDNTASVGKLAAIAIKEYLERHG